MNFQEDLSSRYFEGENRELAKDSRTIEIRGEKFAIIAPEEFRKIKRDTSPKIVGYVKRKNENYTDRKYGTLYFLKGSDRYCFDVFSERPFLNFTYGYVKTSEGAYIEAVSPRKALLVLAFVLLGILLGLLMLFSLRNDFFQGAGGISDVEKISDAENSDQGEESDSNRIDSEDDSQNTEKDSISSATDFVAYITLPDGRITIEEAGSERLVSFSGNSHIEVVIECGGKKLLLNQDVQLENGSFQALTLDFENLAFEVKPGIYYGTISVTYPDGTTRDFSICVIVRETSGGTSGIGYSDKVYVDKERGEVSLNYVQGPSSHMSQIAILIKEEEREVKIAGSGNVAPGESVETLKLDEAAAGQIMAGTYQGILRVTFAGEGDSLTDIKSDINVLITVS